VCTSDRRVLRSRSPEGQWRKPYGAGLVIQKEAELQQRWRLH